MTIEMIFVAAVIVLMLLGMVFEVMRPEVIAFATLVFLILSGILDSEEALFGFSNEGMLTIALLFIIAGAIQKSGMLEYFLTKRFKGNVSKQSVLFILIPISGISAFLNNTPIVAALTPLLKKWGQKNGVAASKLLIPLSYVTILGGTITVIGTSTNLIVNGLMIDRDLPGFDFFTLAVIGIPITIIGFIYLFTVGLRMLPDHKDVTEKVEATPKDYLAAFNVDSKFAHVNKPLKETNIEKLDGLYVIEIIRENNERVSPVHLDTIIKEGDRLVFTGVLSSIAELQRKKGLSLVVDSQVELDDLKNKNRKVIEIVIPAESSLVYKTIKNIQFRQRYNAGIIAIHRNSTHIKNNIAEINLRPGDSLLLLADEEFAEKFHESNDFYIVSSPADLDTFTPNLRTGWIIIGLFVLMIGFVTFGVWSMFQAMALLVILLLFTKLIKPGDAIHYIQFNVLLLVASTLGVSVAMTKTGLAQFIAEQMITFAEPYGLFATLLLIYLATNIFTEFITNTGAAALMLPIGLNIASSMNLDPMGIAVIIAIAASASFITPIGYQTNLIVFGPGGYKFTDYMKVGTPLSLLTMITTVTIVYFYWF